MHTRSTWPDGCPKRAMLLFIQIAVKKSGLLLQPHLCGEMLPQHADFELRECLRPFLQTMLQGRIIGRWEKILRENTHIGFTRNNFEPMAVDELGICNRRRQLNDSITLSDCIAVAANNGTVPLLHFADTGVFGRSSGQILQ